MLGINNDVTLVQMCSNLRSDDVFEEFTALAMSSFLVILLHASILQ